MTTDCRVLSAEQIEQFITRGWTKIESAFAPEVALACQDFLWQRLNARYDVVRENQETWNPPMAFIAENYDTPPFNACATENLRGGGTLIVEGSHQIVVRYLEKNPGQTQQQAIKGCIASSEYLQKLSDCSQSAMKANAWSEHSGPIIPFERNMTPRIEEFMDQCFADENGAELRVIELTGEPGDVYLGHPLMFHSPSFNHSGMPRFMCNRKTPLHQDMNFQRADGSEYSALEESIRRALKTS